MAKGTKSLHHGLKVDNAGNVYMKGTNVEPADDTVSEGETVYWLDTTGPVKIRVKTRAGGAVYAGEVSTLT